MRSDGVIVMSAAIGQYALLDEAYARVNCDLGGYVEPSDHDGQVEQRTVARCLRILEALGATWPESRKHGPTIATEDDPNAGITTVTLRDTRPLAEQHAGWDRLRATVKSWGVA